MLNLSYQRVQRLGDVFILYIKVQKKILQKILTGTASLMGTRDLLRLQSTKGSLQHIKLITGSVSSF